MKLCNIHKIVSNGTLHIINGIPYKLNGWYGCQIQSWEPRPLLVGNMRRILGYDMSVNSVTRVGMWEYIITWTMSDISLRNDHVKYGAAIQEFQNIVRNS